MTERYACVGYVGPGEAWVAASGDGVGVIGGDIDGPCWLPYTTKWSSEKAAPSTPESRMIHFKRGQLHNQRVKRVVWSKTFCGSSSPMFINAGKSPSIVVQMTIRAQSDQVSRGVKV